MRRSILLLVAVFWIGTGVSAQKYYDPDIAGIIEAHGCTGCHGFSGGLNLSTYASLMVGGSHGVIVVPGDTNSNMILKLKPNPPFGERMPFGGPYLTDDEIATVVQWVREGAMEKATVGVGDAEPELPAAFALRQNFPNPFNPSTVISFVLPGSARARLLVFDLLGREVGNPLDAVLPAGEHVVRFEAGGLASGIYVYRLEAGEFVATRRMLLVR